MIDTLENTVKIVKPHISKKLASFETLTHIDKIANLLPNIPVTLDMGFECHLGSNTQRTDFLVSFDASSIKKIIEDKHISFIDDPITSIDHRIQKFFSYCINTNSSLSNNVDNVWFEFDCDVEQHNQESPKPSIFFAPNYDEQKNSSSVISSTDNWISDKALKILFNNSLSKQIKQQLLRCFKVLPKEGKIFQIGVMLPRESESEIIRLCVEGVQKKQIQNYLQQIGYSKENEELNSLLSEISKLVDVIKLNFAINDTILPKLGFECYINEQPTNSSRWNLFFDYLTCNNLCGSEKAEAISSWLGYSEKDSYETLWPTNFSNATALTQNNLKSTIVRVIHHVKIVYQPNEPLQAKAYLWFCHRWLFSDGKFRK